jgi:metal-responsive CopG/Arc/MetJ family transcriptional regulator
MKTAISIPDHLFEDAEAMARHLGISRSELYQRAVASYLEHEGQQAITDALNAVYGEDPESSRLDPAWEAALSEVLEREEW